MTQYKSNICIDQSDARKDRKPGNEKGYSREKSYHQDNRTEEFLLEPSYAVGCRQPEQKSDTCRKESNDETVQDRFPKIVILENLGIVGERRFENEEIFKRLYLYLCLEGCKNHPYKGETHTEEYQYKNNIESDSLHHISGRLHDTSPINTENLWLCCEAS
jgi:hypothetical protein